MSERFGEQILDKKGPGIVGKVDHFPKTVSVVESDSSFTKKIITGNDSGSEEELTSALDMMLNGINFPASALEEELDGNQEKIDKVNVLIGEYLKAVKGLDIKKQKEAKELLNQLLG